MHTLQTIMFVSYLAGILLISCLMYSLPSDFILSGITHLLRVDTSRESTPVPPGFLQVSGFMLLPMKFLSRESYDQCSRGNPEVADTLSTLFERTSDYSIGRHWINSCVIVLTKNSTGGPLLHVYDVLSGFFVVDMGYDDNIDMTEIGCPLFQVKLDSEIDEDVLQSNPSMVVPELEVSETVVFTVANKFKYLISEKYWKFTWNRAYYCGLLAYTQFFHFGGDSVLQGAHPWFLKPLAARLSLRHALYALFQDMDSFYPDYAIQHQVPIQEYFVSEMNEINNPVQLVFGSWKGSWVNSGVWLAQRSSRLDVFFCQWFALGFAEKPHHSYPMLNDQVALWQVLMKTWHEDFIASSGCLGTCSSNHSIEFHEHILKVGNSNYKKSQRILCQALDFYHGAKVEPDRGRRWASNGTLVKEIPGHRRYGLMYMHANAYNENETLPIFHCMQCYYSRYFRKPRPALIFHTGHMSAIKLQNVIPLP